MSDIVGLKLLDGSEVIASLIDETDTHYNLENAIFWQPVEVEKEKYDIQFYPISFGLKVKPNTDHAAVDLLWPKHSVLFKYENVRDEIVERYRKMVSPIMLLRP